MRRTIAALTIAVVTDVTAGLMALLGIPAAPRRIALVISGLLGVIRLLGVACVRAGAVRTVLAARGPCAVTAFCIPCMAIIGVLALRLGATRRIAVLRVEVVVTLCTRLRRFAAVIPGAI